MPESRQTATARAALRLIGAVASGNIRRAEKIILTAPNMGELTYAVTTLMVQVLMSCRINPTEFIERGLADIARAERENADA